MFLFLLWLWLRTKAEDYADLPDFSGSPSFGTGDTGAPYVGHGGDFGGGGTTASFDAPSTGIVDVSDSGTLLAMPSVRLPMRMSLPFPCSCSFSQAP